MQTTQTKKIIIMSNNNSVVAIFKSHIEAEAAVKELQHSGFDMKKLSIVGRDYHTDENVVGYYNAGDRMKYWGKLGAFWGGFWGLLFGSAFFYATGNDRAGPNGRQHGAPADQTRPSMRGLRPLAEAVKDLVKD
jgi:hypothetical protein